MAQDFSPAGVRYPVLHRHKVPFEPVIHVPDGFAEQAYRVQRLDEELNEMYVRPADYLELVNEALAANIHYSTMLEGNPLSHDEVRQTTRRLLSAPRPPASTDPEPVQEIFTHLFLWLMPQRSRPPWTVQTILGLHRGLFLQADPKAQPGRLRTHDDGGFGVYTTQGQLTFRPCPAGHAQAELQSLLDWRNRVAPGVHPIVAAAVFYHEFESIHPFEDGNGRLGRTLFHYILHHGGLRNAHLCLIEPRLMSDRERYYALLAWADQENDYGPLVQHVGEGLTAAYEEAVRRWRERNLLTSGLDGIDSRLIVNARHRRAPFSVRDAADWVPRRSDQTVRNHLNGLVRQGIMEATGKTAAKRYTLVDPLRAMREFLHINAATVAGAATDVQP